MKQHAKLGRELLKKYERPKALGRRTWRNLPERIMQDTLDWVWKPLRVHWPDMPKKALRDLIILAIVKAAEDEDAG